MNIGHNPVWHFLGGIRTVTGSCHMLEVGNERLLIDCGLFQGRRKEAFKRNRSPSFDAKKITRVVLGHAHMDHSGNLPTLVKLGFHGAIYSTHATRDLATFMLRDSSYIQRRDAEYVNKRERRRGEDRVKPLYNDADVDATLSLFSTRGYHRSFSPIHRVRVTFYPAGHILGSALTLIEVQTETGTLRIGYIVDLGRPDRPILRDPEQLVDLDVMIIESTYGNRDHEDLTGAKERLARVINETCRRGGKVIIPAFSLGRTQELVKSIADLMADRRVPDIPVFVDSPLAVNVSGVFALHPEEFDSETYAQLIGGGDPLGANRVTYIQSVQESKSLNTRKEPCIVISASGMCEGGRILHHLRNSIGDSKNTIAIVGYQAPHTLGHKLVTGERRVRIFGEELVRKAQIEKLNAYSAHADRADLIRYIKEAGDKLRAVYLVHGEDEQQQALETSLIDKGYTGIHRPNSGDVVVLK